MGRFVNRVNVALTALVLAAATAACAGLAGGRIATLDLAAHFAPIYAVVAAAGLVWAVLAGRGPIVAAAILGLVASAALMMPEFRRETGPTASPGRDGEIKVIQINALRDNADVARVAAWLLAQRPDIVTISEARHDLRDRLVRAGWKTAGGHSSLMIFTRQRYLHMDRPRPSGAKITFINATYASASGPLEAVTVHLDWPTHPEIAARVRTLEAVTAARPRDRMILTGDFNTTPWSAQMRRLDRTLGLIRRDRAVATWPAQVAGQPWPLPFLPIDHVYAGPGWATVKVERGPWLGSDHYPLIVTLAPVAPR